MKHDDTEAAAGGNGDVAMEVLEQTAGQEEVAQTQTDPALTLDADFTQMNGPGLVSAYNTMVDYAEGKGIAMTKVKSFKTVAVGVERCQKAAEKIKTAGTTTEKRIVSKTTKKAGGKKPAAKKAKKSAAKKAAAAKPAKEPKKKFGHDITITQVAENPRFKGSKAHRLFESMSKWVAKNPGKSVADLIAATDYRRQDFVWDQERGTIKTRKL